MEGRYAPTLDYVITPRNLGENVGTGNWKPSENIHFLECNNHDRAESKIGY